MIRLSTKLYGFSGWAYGFSQPVIVGQFRMQDVPGIEWNTIDPMMRSLFCDADAMVGFIGFKGPDAESRHPVADLILFWVVSMQQKAGLPVFEPGRVLSEQAVSKTETQYRFALPYVQPDVAVQILSLVVDTLNKLTDKDSQLLINDAVKKARISVVQIVEKLAKNVNASSIRFAHAAFVLGIPWRRLVVNIYEFGYGALSRWLDSSFSDCTSVIGSKIARNKTLASVVLKQAGLPVPVHVVVDSPEKAEIAARQLGFPVVVKPMDLDGGKGVSAGLKDVKTVRTAFNKALGFSSSILVEKHIEGRDYRLYVFHGSFVWGVERIPGGVTGNGENSIAELVEILNADPRRGIGPRSPLKRLDMDGDVLALLKEEGFTPDSVPGVGHFVRLRRSSNISCGGMPVVVTDKVHPDNRRLAERAARALRLDFAGVDFLTPDISRSWLQTGGGICEVNAQPQLGAIAGVHLYGELLKSIIEGDGRIPLVLVIGETGNRSANKTALEIQAQLRTGALRVGIVSGDGAWIDEQPQEMIGSDFFMSCCTLLSCTEVDALVFAATVDEVLKTGLPFDYCDVIVLPGFDSAYKKNIRKTGHSMETLFKEACKIALPHAKKGIVVNMEDPICRQASSLPGIQMTSAGKDVEGLAAATLDILGIARVKNTSSEIKEKSPMSDIRSDKSTVSLRRPDAKDWPRILEILEFVNYHHIGGSEMPVFPLADCFAAEVDGIIAGVAGYRILDSQTAKTTLMAVDPLYRRHGVGMILQRARMDFLSARGIRYLYTNCDDQRVIDWYSRHFSYRPTGERVPKTEDFGLPDKTEWTTLVCDLDCEGTGVVHE